MQRQPHPGTEVQILTDTDAAAAAAAAHAKEEEEDAEEKKEKRDTFMPSLAAAQAAADTLIKEEVRYILYIGYVPYM